jgi:DNA-binding MarR family transcriptional regulator
MPKLSFYSEALEIKVLGMLLMKSAVRDLEKRLHAAKLDVNPLGFGVLCNIKKDSSGVNELSKKMMLAPATLVPVINALEKKGIIARKKDPRDQRRSPLYITHRGEKLLAKVPAIRAQDALLRRIEALGSKDMAALHRILRKLAAEVIGKEKIEEIMLRAKIMHMPSK